MPPLRQIFLIGIHLGILLNH